MPIIQKLSWQQFETDMLTLVQRIKSDPRSKSLDHLLLITRGGLIPGGFLAQHLGIKKIKTLCLQSYSDDRTKQSSIERLVVQGFEKEEILEPHRWLILDEMTDTGNSILYAKNLYPDVLTACVYVKDPTITDFYSVVLDSDAWIDFPWELYAN